MTKPASFQYFKTSPEIIRLAVMLDIRFPLSLRNVEYLLHEPGIDVSYETVRHWWNRFGPLFASDIRRRRVQQLRAFSKWKWHGCAEEIVTDRFISYKAAFGELGALDKQKTGRWINDRVENSHLPFRRRERAVQRFRRMRSPQKFAAVHASVYSHFNQERSLSRRPNFKLNRTAALAEWRQLGVA